MEQRRVYAKSPLHTKEALYAIISGISSEYGLDPSIETTLNNIKHFIGSLDEHTIISAYPNIDEAIQHIIKLYGEMSKAKSWSIADSNELMHQKLLNIINVPGDDAGNLGKEYKDTFRGRDTFANKRKEGLGNGSPNILNMDIAQRIETIKYLNYSSLFREEYIIVDSRYQSTVNNDPSKIIFNLITNTKIRSNNGGIIIGNNIKNIIQIEIAPFTIPYKPIFANFYNKITLSINEWITNSYEAYEGGQFHFIFDIDKIDNNLIYLVPNDRVYSFSKPMNYIDNFTLSFGAMLPKIEFDADRMYILAFDYSSEYGILTFATEHHLVTGDLIYISGFSTPDPARDTNIISEVNRDQGHIIVKKDNYSVLINVNLSLVRHEDPIGSGQYPIDTFSQVVLTYFASKRIMIPIRLKYLTNYSAA